MNITHDLGSLIFAVVCFAVTVACLAWVVVEHRRERRVERRRYRDEWQTRYTHGEPYHWWADDLADADSRAVSK